MIEGTYVAIIIKCFAIYAPDSSRFRLQISVPPFGRYFFTLKFNEMLTLHSLILNSEGLCYFEFPVAVYFTLSRIFDYEKDKSVRR